ncbi:hypothetical protein GCM10009837_69950 [Streptomyces durmitorensis]|uniref:Uncharacterized protein n=1 Tax=Streptomyces durmitorensis TaxID=319947 RepID=A0ABY4PV32_9ACTN|nr:hypothetical protein [Streptomyces durmitorensis]UQT56788.1 hypothetical protein M4V62_17740 [Streptomyces durmitorensis]
MGAPEERGAGIHIGSVEGAFAIGDGNEVTYYEAGGPVRDRAQEELLSAVRRLREDLRRAAVDGRTTALDAELAAAEAEIASPGGAGPGRLARLRTALADAGTGIGALASGAAVAESVRALLGG